MPFREDPDRPALKEIMLVNKRHYEHRYNVLLSDSYHKIFNRSAARNHGVNKTDDDVVILIDATTKVPLKFLDSLVDLALANQDSVVKIIAWDMIHHEHLYESTWSPGRFWVMHRSVWDRLGGFSEAYVTHGLEDLDFLLRAAVHAEVRWVVGRAIAYSLPLGKVDGVALKNNFMIYSDTFEGLRDRQINFKYEGLEFEVDASYIFNSSNYMGIDDRAIWDVNVDRARQGLL